MPFTDGQAVSKPAATPSASLQTIAKALEFAVEAIVNNDADINGEAMGTTH